MTGTVETALDLWGLAGARSDLVAARENAVYRVEQGGRTVALRLHRTGYRTDAELASELQWMAALAEGGLNVPAPVAARDDALLHVVDGVQVDVLGWLNGRPLGASGVPLEHPDRTGLFRGIGREMAHLHALSDAWSPPPEFTRCRWDRTGLVGEAPVWGRFWDNPALSEADRALFRDVREVAGAELRALGPDVDFGLIHADLVRENILVDGERLHLIDFDDGGFGFRLFDVATTLLKNMREPDYPALRDALIEGYRSVRPLDPAPLDLFVLLRAASYVGWIAQRMDEDGAAERCARYAAQTRGLAGAWLEARAPIADGAGRGLQSHEDVQT
ncbi:phosphotransferase [Roseicyclus sp. F158]|uniref:Phosphotransferase n=1 Tax=Tropicimonas omnivorans TaxID=3075590 RepID=A0ABU3DH65_9RHOB|nr:phosphotransferase [Roseicyclus sp. F158]MDT0683049.1 phosphotransferase [Roseicyclus sp. F158]